MKHAAPRQAAKQKKQHQRLLKIVGHRGARGLAAENTLAGIDAALEHQVDEIEIDVRITADNIAVLAHDPWIRTQKGPLIPIRQYTFKQLRQHKPDLVSLKTAIQHLDRRAPLQMEVKWGEPTAPVIAVVRQYLKDGWQAEDFLFGSKKQRTLLELHRALPEVPTVIIEPYLSLRGVLRARQLNTKRLSMNYLGLWPGFLRSMRRRGYQVYAYTLDNPDKARAWLKDGLFGVITDYPSDYR